MHEPARVARAPEPTLAPEPVFLQARPSQVQVCTPTELTEVEKVYTPPFLIGEEVRDEIGLSDGKKIFIDDVLETAKWYVLWQCGVYPHSEQIL